LIEITLRFGNFYGVSHRTGVRTRGEKKSHSKKPSFAGGENQKRWAIQTCEQLGGEAEPLQTGGNPRGGLGPNYAA
jgi:hypothetical protein